MTRPATFSNNTSPASCPTYRMKTPWAPSVSSMRPAPRRRAPRPPASNANGAANSARRRTVSSPSTWRRPWPLQDPPRCRLVPAQSWDQDRDRCRAAGIPDDVVYRPKWQIALEQTDRAGSGHRVRLADLRRRLWRQARLPAGAGGASARLSARCPSRSAAVEATRRPAGQQPGRRPGAAQSGVPQPVAGVRLPRQTVGEQVWEVKAARVWLSWDRSGDMGCSGHGTDGRARRSTSCRMRRRGRAVRMLLKVAFRRWNVEHGFRMSKSEVGFRHFEGRNYTALMRHLTLCLVTMTFVAGQAAQLRGEKSGGDAGAGVCSAELAVAGLAGTATGDRTGAEHVGGHLLSPAA